MCQSLPARFVKITVLSAAVITDAKRYCLVSLNESARLENPEGVGYTENIA